MMEYVRNTPGALKENWEKHKEKLKSRYPALTDADLHFEPGRKDEMFKRVKIKLGITDENLNKVFRS